MLLPNFINADGQFLDNRRWVPTHYSLPSQVFKDSSLVLVPQCFFIFRLISQELISLSRGLFLGIHPWIHVDLILLLIFKDLLIWQKFWPCMVPFSLLNLSEFNRLFVVDIGVLFFHCFKNSVLILSRKPLNHSFIVRQDFGVFENQRDTLIGESCVRCNVFWFLFAHLKFSSV